MHRTPAFLLCLAALTATGARAQSPAPAVTWQDLQTSQAWATEQLRKSPRRHQWVEIALGGRTLKALLTYPPTEHPAPVVLVLHEVFGLTDSTLATADAIAAMGYPTLAPDMLSGFAPDGGGSSGFPSTRAAGNFMTLLPDDTVNATLNAWSDYAARLPGSDGSMAVVGLSWGGGAAFRYAASGVHRDHLRAVYVFYDVGPPAVTQGPEKFDKDAAAVSLDRLDVPVHGFYPQRDTRVMASLQRTRDAMTAAGKPFDAVVYPGAEHAYMRLGAAPGDGNPANAAALKASLARLQTSLAALPGQEARK